MENALPISLKRVLRHTVPWFYDQLWRFGPRNYPIVRAITRDGGWTVHSGPFVGMRFVRHSTGSSLPPKLLGAYERELHGFVERAVAARPSRVVDVGSAEGYYAVGFAMRLPGAQIHAFDTEPLARTLCRDLARLNGVEDRVYTHGLCTQQNLAELAPALIICDCEGCELELLDPVRVPELAACSLVVELHDFLDPRISREILTRFEPTHTIETVSSGPHRVQDYPELAGLTPELAELALEEARPGIMEWAYMIPRP